MSAAASPVLNTKHRGARVWWLESDRSLSRLLEERFKACGWNLHLFHQTDALAAGLKHEVPDLLLLDITLSTASGKALLRRLSLERLPCPVLILSAQASPEERIDALAAGANDVISKPFHFKELAWRMERLLQMLSFRKLRHPSCAAVVSAGPLMLDTIHNCLRTQGGVGVPLSRGDRALLLPLLQSPGVVISREQLAEACGSLVDVAASRTLDVRLSRLRRLLRQMSGDAVSIEAVRRLGYRLTIMPP